MGGILDKKEDPSTGLPSGDGERTSASSSDEEKRKPPLKLAYARVFSPKAARALYSVTRRTLARSAAAETPTDVLSSAKDLVSASESGTTADSESAAALLGSALLSATEEESEAVRTEARAAVDFRRLTTLTKDISVDRYVDRHVPDASDTGDDAVFVDPILDPPMDKTVSQKRVHSEIETTDSSDSKKETDTEILEEKREDCDEAHVVDCSSRTPLSASVSKSAGSEPPAAESKSVLSGTTERLLTASGSRHLVWGYAESSHKRCCEDQAAYACWLEPLAAEWGADALCHVWAVFDGHGSYDCALYCAQHFVSHLRQWQAHCRPQSEAQWRKVIERVFTKFDRHMQSLGAFKGGSTVQLVILTSLCESGTLRRLLISANAGDARACLSHANGTRVQQLSYDHSPLNDWQRIMQVYKTGTGQKQEPYSSLLKGKFRVPVSARESLSDLRKLPLSERKLQPIVSREFQHKSRLLGTIGVARSLGDFELRVFGMRQVPVKPWISCVPYTTFTYLSDFYECASVAPVTGQRQAEDGVEPFTHCGSMPLTVGVYDLLLLACDGVFDVLSNFECLALLQRHLFGADTSPTDATTRPLRSLSAQHLDAAAQMLAAVAYKRGSFDDVTVFIVPLFHALHFN